MHFLFKLPSGEVKTIHLNRHTDGSYTARIDDRTYHVQAETTPRGSLKLKLGEQTFRLEIAKAGHDYHVALHGQTFHLQKMTSARPARGSSTSYEGDLTANLPGQVTQVLVQVGDVVEKGQTLILLEAMKMEMRVRAPMEGKIKAILCRVGQAVERGQPLLELEQVG